MVREALLRRGTAYGTRDAALAELVGRARAGEPWKTGLAGVLLPGLRATVGPAARAYPRYRSELEAEALAGLLEALPRVRLERGRIAASLIWSARRSADRFLGRELRHLRTRARLHSEASGRDVRVPKDDLEELTPQKTSLMPDNVVSQLSFDQFIDLLAFLKSQKAQESLRGAVLEFAVATGYKPSLKLTEDPESNPDTTISVVWASPICSWRCLGFPHSIAPARTCAGSSPFGLDALARVE